MRRKGGSLPERISWHRWIKKIQFGITKIRARGSQQNDRSQDENKVSHHTNFFFSMYLCPLQAQQKSSRSNSMRSSRQGKGLEGQRMRGAKQKRLRRGEEGPEGPIKTDKERTRKTNRTSRTSRTSTRLLIRKKFVLDPILCFLPPG